MADLLNVEHLSVSFFTPAGEVQAVRDVSFSLKAGEVLAIVGESGCGKSVLCKSILRLLPQTAKIKSGKIIVDGTDITAYRERKMTALRGSLFSMVFQDPMTALDPTMTIGAQIAEAVLAHRPKLEKSAVRARVIELLELVGIDRAQERMALYPHSFSGGMRQRVVLAIALAGDPRILFADEPTTALDVTIQAQILDLLRDVQQKLGTAEEIFYDPRHPYTWSLLRSLPALSRGKETLPSIPGMPPTLIDPPQGDAFATRNEYALAIDYEEAPPMFRVSDTHYAATWLLDERAPKITPPVGGAR